MLVHSGAGLLFGSLPPFRLYDTRRTENLMENPELGASVVTFAVLVSHRRDYLVFPDGSTSSRVRAYRSIDDLYENLV